MNDQTILESLFTESNPRSYGYKSNAEGEFAYLNSHRDAPILAARELLEQWYVHFPSAHRVDLARRFRSKSQKQHDGAFWELYLHELFRRMGYQIEVHPNLKNFQTHPDFLLLKDGSPFAFVEAKLAGLSADKETSSNRLAHEFHDELNRVHSPNFFLQIDEIRTAPVRPSFKRLLNEIEEWLETLDPDLPMEIFLAERNKRMRFEWEHEGWYLALKVIPKSPGYRGREGGRAVGVSSTGFQWLDTRGELRKALNDKAGKYGGFNLPFLIAINYMGVHCNREDWTDALYGTPAVNIWYDENGIHRQEPFRKSDGFWASGGKVRQRQVSAIIGGWHISPWSMGAHPLELYEHFSAEYPIDLNGNLPCWYLPAGSDQLALRSGRSSAEILEIPKPWPGEWNSE